MALGTGWKQGVYYSLVEGYSPAVRLVTHMKHLHTCLAQISSFVCLLSAIKNSYVELCQHNSLWVLAKAHCVFSKTQDPHVWQLTQVFKAYYL